jgi:hypothetical protein
VEEELKRQRAQRKVAERAEKKQVFRFAQDDKSFGDTSQEFGGCIARV